MAGRGRSGSRSGRGGGGRGGRRGSSHRSRCWAWRRVWWVFSFGHNGKVAPDLACILGTVGIQVSSDHRIVTRIFSFDSVLEPELELAQIVQRDRLRSVCVFVDFRFHTANQGSNRSTSVNLLSLADREEMFTISEKLVLQLEDALFFVDDICSLRFGEKKGLSGYAVVVTCDDVTRISLAVGRWDLEIVGV